MKKYPMELREQVVQRIRGGESQRALSREYGISRWAIQSWLKETALPKQRGRKPAKALQEYKYENKRLKYILAFTAANRNYYEVKYIRLPDLLVEIAMARATNTYQDLMRRYKKVPLLILDEWLLYSLKETEARDLLELVEARNKVSSTIFCSQFDVNEWHASLYDPTMADAICDRIVYNAHIIKIEGDSMRKRAAIAE